MVLGEHGAKRCECRLRQIRQTKLDRIPRRYREADLVTMKPKLEAHPQQAEVIEMIRSAPFESYLFVGCNATGKTHLLWAMYRNAIDARRQVAACSATQLLDEYRSMIRLEAGEVSRVTVCGADLRDIPFPCSIFLDDLDKARPTEYAAEQLFDLIDAAYSHQHQLVVTSNLDVQELAEHFARADARYGISIVRRIADCNVVRLF